VPGSSPAPEELASPKDATSFAEDARSPEAPPDERPVSALAFAVALVAGSALVDGPALASGPSLADGPVAVVAASLSIPRAEAIQDALLPGGMVVFETYTRAQMEFAHGPHNPAFLLETGELRNAFPSLDLVFYRELRAGQGIASLVAQKPGNTK